MKSTLPLPESKDSSLWQVLRLFNLYRIILASGLLLVSKFHLKINFFIIYDEHLFYVVCVAYFVASFLFLLTSLFLKKYYTLQANLSIFTDIPALLVIMHASGGLISGVGILFIVIVAAHSLLVPGKISIFSAAIAAIGIILEHSYSYFIQHNTLQIFPQVGLLGASLLITSWLTNLLSLRAHKSEMFAKRKAFQLAASEQLNAHIVSALQSGVIVLDNAHHIRLFNTAAKNLLELYSGAPKTLHDLPFSFQQCFRQWEQEGKNILYLDNIPQSTIRLHFLSLGKGLPAGVLVFVFDAQEETRHAQDLKLASLGHLTANIAHEIRNPLCAASHAAQLLAESVDLSNENKDLINMIKQSCDRMNTVIQNVLSLSSHKIADIQQINLIDWLEAFIQTFSIPSIDHPQIHLEYDHNPLMIHFDPSQLTQILINLCDNGLRASLRQCHQPLLTISVQKNESTHCVCIDIIDEGAGIPPENAKHIFEPFFTTEKSGSGLGLYIARELSHMNSARLEHVPTSTGCQFRIILPLGEIYHDATRRVNY